MSSYLTRSFMFPELREEINKLYREEIRERPILDEQEMELINRVLVRSYQEGKEIVLRYWKDGVREVTGRVIRFDTEQITLVTNEKVMAIVLVNDIIDASDN